MTNAIGVNLRTETLGNNVCEIILEVLGNARYHSNSHRSKQQPKYVIEELLKRLATIITDVNTEPVKHLTCNQRVEQGEALVDGSKRQGKNAKPLVVLKIGEKKLHS